MGVITDLRDGVYDAIDAGRDPLNLYPIPNFTLEKSWMPEFKIANAKVPDPLVSVVGQSFSSDRITRGQPKSKTSTVPVTVGIHSRCNPKDLAQVDLLVDFYETVVRQVEIDTNVQGFSWSNTQPLRDEAGQPYAFVVFREEHVFQAIFYSYFNVILC